MRALLLLLLLAIAVSASAQVAHSVFLRNSEIYITADGSSEPRQLTGDGREKRQLVQTKDGSRFAFVRESQGVKADIVVMEPDGKMVREILFRPVEETWIGMRWVEHLQWISNQRLVASGSVNPSTSEYAVIDVEAGQQVTGYFVDGFAWAASPDAAHAAYVGFVQHFMPEANRRPQFCIDDECNLDKSSGYPAPDVHLEFTSAPLWSDDSKAVVMIAEEYGTGTERVIVRRLGGMPFVLIARPGLEGNLTAAWDGQAVVLRAAKRVWRLEPAASAFVAQ